jgi:hypothetical protein
MKTPLLAAFLAGILTVAGAAAIVSTSTVTDALSDVLGTGRPGHGAGADEEHVRHGTSGDAHGEQLGMERLRFPPSQGTTPTADEAKRLESVGHVHIQTDKDLTPANGIRKGSGTLDDPFVISGYHVTGDLAIYDTDLCLLITGNWFDSQLRLNWNGNCVHVHHNFIRDLRVNENIPRDGLATGGLIEDNVINYVGQIRHYNGEFRNNVIGPRDDARLPYGIFDDPENLIPFFKDTRILNVDGFDQGWFHHNTVVGSVDLKLHGHHHGTGFLATHSHYHGDDKARMREHAHDHTQRWHSVRFEDNKVTDPAGYGLRYVDQAHAGDDRTAASESTEELGKEHRHRTKVEIRRNHVVGAGIWVDVFNADDRLHKMRNPGWFWVTDNTVELKERPKGLLGEQFFGRAYDPNVAIRVDDAKEATFDIRGNTLSWKEDASARGPLPAIGIPFFAEESRPTAILFQGVRDATLLVQDNRGTGFAHGVAAASMDEKAHWLLAGNDFSGASQPVYYDRSVENKPREERAAPLADPGAWGDEGDQPTSDQGHEHRH